MTTLTNELATALIVQVDMIPKQKPCAIGIPEVDEDGRGHVTIKTQVSTVTIQKWFQSCDMFITRFHWVGKNTWECSFRLMASEVESD